MVATATTIRINERVVDLARGMVKNGGTPAATLRPQALAVLKLLSENPGTLITKDELMTAVWPNVAVTDDSLVQCITEVRKALGDDKHALIKTVSKRGYVFEPPAEGKATPVAKSWKLLLAASVLVLAVIAGSLWFTRPTPVPAQPPSIAVLPFDNLSDDPQQAFFADGIAEDLLTDLSRLSGVFVIARNSSFAYRGRDVDAHKAAKELAVRYLVEGSVRRDGDKVRVNVQLIDGKNGVQQWAERYDGSYSDIFALQDKVTAAVVRELALEMKGPEQAALSQHDTSLPLAYEAFLRGWEYYQRTTPEDYRKAIPHFERAVELDPAYGRALAALAMVYFRSYDQRWAGSLGLSADQAFRKARDYLNLAKAHPTSTLHQVAGNISRGRGWYDDALKEFSAAIALEPSDSWSYADLAYAMVLAGDPVEAEKQIDKAMRLDPRYPPTFLFYKGLAQFAQGNRFRLMAVSVFV